MTIAGETIGPYQLRRCLGSGGFGVVYEAAHQTTGQRVAVKVLHGTKELEPEVQNRFVREITLLERLDDPNIVRVFDAGLHEGSIYCAMELVECGTLKDVLSARWRLPWREAVEVALQVCRALSHAHQRGCVHRDLKPANLYLSEDGLVKLGDLGLARDMENFRLTTAGHTVGTWRYMAPEQIRGEDKIDGRLDLYALGCILFEMISGKVPFDGPDFASIFDQHLESAPPRLDILTGDCPKELADLVDQMLEKAPDDRPTNAEQVAECLAGILAGTPITCRASRKFARAAAISPDEPVLNLTQRLQSGPLADQPPTNWRLWALVAAAVVIVGGILLLMKR